MNVTLVIIGVTFVVTAVALFVLYLRERGQDVQPAAEHGRRRRDPVASTTMTSATPTRPQSG